MCLYSLQQIGRFLHVGYLISTLNDNDCGVATNLHYNTISSIHLLRLIPCPGPGYSQPLLHLGVAHRELPWLLLAENFSASSVPLLNEYVEHALSVQIQPRLQCLSIYGTSKYYINETYLDTIHLGLPWTLSRSPCGSLARTTTLYLCHRLYYFICGEICATMPQCCD